MSCLNLLPKKMQEMGAKSSYQILVLSSPGPRELEGVRRYLKTWASCATVLLQGGEDNLAQAEELIDEVPVRRLLVYYSNQEQVRCSRRIWHWGC